MKTFFLKSRLRREAKTIHMEPEALRRTREALVRAMEQEPVRNLEASRQLSQKLLFFSFRPMPFFLALALLLGGGGTVAAAQSSLPGDTLYPIKTQFTEEIRGAFAGSTEARVDWDADRLERRLQERAELMEQGRFEGPHAQALEEKMEAHIEKARARVEDMPEGQRKLDLALRMNARIEGALRAHQQILERLESNTNLSEERRAEIEANVQERLEHLQALQTRLTAQVETRVAEHGDEAATRMREAAVKGLADTRAFLTAHDADLSAEIKTAAITRLTEADGLLAKGDISFAAKAYLEAFRSFESAHRIALEVHARARADLALPQEGGYLRSEGFWAPRRGPLPDRDGMREGLLQRREESRGPQGEAEIEIEADADLGIPALGL